MVSILAPPPLLAPHVLLRGFGVQNAPLFQCDRNAFKISAASTRRPATTSASD